MKLKAVKNTREKLNIKAKNFGIKKPTNMSITDLLNTMTDTELNVIHTDYAENLKN